MNLRLSFGVLGAALAFALSLPVSEIRAGEFVLEESVGVSLLRTAIQLEWVDRAIVSENAQVYDRLFGSIQKAAQTQDLGKLATHLDELEFRTQRQLGWMGKLVFPMVAPELNEALSAARTLEHAARRVHVPGEKVRLTRRLILLSEHARKISRSFVLRPIQEET